jgi:predicted ferric reductase
LEFNKIRLVQAALIWVALAAAVAVPLVAAAMSPLLAWRGTVYITAAFAGVIALGLLLVQPVLIGGYVPGLSPNRSRYVHRWIGSMLFAAVVVHVGGLWITSPPDVLDALLFESPTTFSAWGVIAMWATFAAAFLAAFRRRLRVRPRTWRVGHTFFSVVIVVGSVVHAILIEGTMEMASKAILCALVIVVTMKVITDRRVWSKRPTLNE